jgi:transcriptional regulator with PAS, ATPase and Fis domain
MQSQLLRSVDQNSLPPQNNFSADGRMLYRKIAHLSNIIASLNAAVEDLESSEVPQIDDEFDFYQEVERFEVSLIRSALRMSGGSQVKAAKLLKLNATTLNAKMKTLKLSQK